MVVLVVAVSVPWIDVEVVVLDVREVVVVFTVAVVDVDNVLMVVAYVVDADAVELVVT